MTIVNTANASTTTPGSTIAYTITITDTGQTSYEDATVTDPLSGVIDDATYNGDAAATAGSVTYTSPDLTWTGNLNPGDTATITYTVTVSNPDTGDKTLTSTATSDAPGSTCPSSDPALACTSTVTDLIPALTITKTATTSATTPGATAGYTITVDDTGQTPYTAATVTDDLTGVLGDAAYNHDAAATAGTVSYASPDLTWTGNLNPGDTATITYTVTVSNPDTGDKHLVNFVTSTDPGSTCPSGSPAPACTATVTDLIPALTITKTAATAATTPGSTVGYTITVDDTGQTPYTAATVTDDLTGVLGDAVYNHDAAATTGTVSYTSPTLTWTGNLTPGTTATITYTVTVNNPDTGSGAMSNTVVSTVPGSTCPAGSASPACSVTVAVVAGPLSITVPATANLGSAAPGGTLSSALGTVQVTDDRGFGAGWTATVAATGFATGNGTPAETIPAADAQYVIAALLATTGSATFTPVPETQLSATPQAVVNATNVAGNTTVTWDPTINVSVPGSAIGGGYTATITHSVSLPSAQSLRPVAPAQSLRPVAPAQSLRPVAAMLTPSPIMTRPPAPPISASRRGEPTSHCRAVPAMAAHALSRTSAMTGNSAPRMSICADTGRCPGAVVVNSGSPATKNTMVFGLATPTTNPSRMARGGRTGVTRAASASAIERRCRIACTPRNAR